jgi:hypothetical protein
MELQVTGVVFFWRGPAPFHFVAVDEVTSDVIHQISASVTYGWGMNPCECVVGSTTFEAALWPKDGGYIIPLKKAVRDRESIAVDDTITVVLLIGD